MSTENNDSRTHCVAIANFRGWKKDKRRNVVTIKDEKWSFSVYSDFKNPECRQVYEDTVGFIGSDRMSGQMVKYRISDWNKYKVSRISPSGIKAYDVSVKIDETSPL